MEGPSLNVVIGANLEKLHHEMGHANEVLEKFSETAVEVGKTLITALSVEKIVDWGKEGYMAAGHFEENMTRLKFATHGNTEELNRLKETAENISHTTLFSGEDLIKQETRLAVMGRTNEQIENILKAATAMASALPDIDLPQAIDALNKSLNGVGKTLVNIDPSFKALTEEQLKNGDAVKLAIEKYGDLATEMTRVGTGPLKDFQKNWDEFLFHLGEKGLNPINATLTGLGNYFHRWNILLDDNAKTTEDRMRDLQAAVDIANINRDRGNWDKLIEDVQRIEKNAKLANREVTDLTDGIKHMFVIKPAPVKFVEGSENNKKTEIVDIETIEGIEKRIKELREKQFTAHGNEIHQLEIEIVELQKKEKLLKEGAGPKIIPHEYIARAKDWREELEKIAKAAHDAAIKHTTFFESFKKMDEFQKKIASGSGISTTIAGYDKITAASKKAEEETKKNLAEQTKTSEEAGRMIGDQLGKVADGQESFANAIIGTSTRIISQYAMEAIAAAGKSGAASPLGVVGAAAAMAAMAALFSSYGLGHGSGGGGSSMPAAADTNHRASMNPAGLSINLIADFKLHGNTLVAALRKANYYTGKTGG